MDVIDVVDRTDAADVVVVGGGAAGLSAALMLGRSRRSVIVVDAGEPRNAPAEGVHGLLGHDGVPPGELLARGRAEVARYGGQVRAGSVATVRRDGDGFDVVLADGAVIGARRLVVATGGVDRLPDIPGLREQWGHGVVHCPYCHGWEIRDRVIGVIATGPMSLHQATLFRQWTDDLVFFTRDWPLSPEDAAPLLARGVRVVDGAVAAIESAGGEVAGVLMGDGGRVAVGAVAVASYLEPRVEFLAELGVPLVDHPSGMGRHIEVDPVGRTAVAGVWAAGNVTDLSAQVGASAAAGALAGAHLNMDLVQADIAAALTAAAPGG